MSSPRLRRNTGTLAEFSPALFVFFFMGLFPLLDLLALAWGEATINLIARQAASRAAGSTDYTQALGVATQEASNLTSSGFGKFANLHPVAGNSNSGLNLYIHQTSIDGGRVTVYGPNTPVPSGSVDESQNIYEYSAQLTCDLSPLCPLGMLPFVSEVPGLGKPARLSATVQMAAEFPDGLSGTGASGGPGGGTGSGGGVGPGLPPPPGGSSGSGGSGSPDAPGPVVPPVTVP